MVILDTLLGLCICKIDSERISASPATNLTARHCMDFRQNYSVKMLTLVDEGGREPVMPEEHTQLTSAVVVICPMCTCITEDMM